MFVIGQNILKVQDIVIVYSHPDENMMIVSKSVNVREHEFGFIHEYGMTKLRQVER